MNPLLRKWLDEKNLEFNHDGYSQETLNALKEFANYVAAQQPLALDGANCPACQAKSVIVGTQCLVCGVFSPRK